MIDRLIHAAGLGLTTFLPKLRIGIFLLSSSVMCAFACASTNASTRNNTDVPASRFANVEKIVVYRLSGEGFFLYDNVALENAEVRVVAGEDVKEILVRSVWKRDSLIMQNNNLAYVRYKDGPDTVVELNRNCRSFRVIGMEGHYSIDEEDVDDWCCVILERCGATE